MATLLLTFLGRPAARRGQGPPGYAETTYDFGHGEVIHDRLFARALFRHLRRRGRRAPERVVMLGTPTSAWRMFGDWQDNPPPETEASLADLARPLSEWLEAEVTPMLTRSPAPAHKLPDSGLALTEAEQIGMVHRLMACVGHGDRLHLDVTHGLRHLPMLGLTCGRLVQALRGARMEAIWYGALDLAGEHGNKAPVVRLDGLSRAMDWSRAFAAFEADGDYTVFRDLLAAEGVSPGLLTDLRAAAFAEAQLRVGEAAERLRGVVDAVRSLNDGTVGALFRDRLLERLAWVEGGDRRARLAALAWRHLDHGDYLRAALSGVEAAKLDGYDHSNSAEFRRLALLRNALAHAMDSAGQGSARDRDAVAAALADEPTLRRELKRLLEALLPPAES